MEEDNAHDIFKWFHTFGTAEQNISITFREETYNAEVTLRGNLLTCVSTIDAKVPLLFVIEGAAVRKYETEDASFACLIGFPDPSDNLILRFDSEKARESWMVKIATCSHQMVRAQLDETAYKFYTMGIKQDADAEDPNTVNSFFLTNPHKVTHNFAISQGPPFRKSTEKHRVAFAPVPTNLHVHHSSIDQRAARGVLSCGTASALPLRFQSGGLTRLCNLLEIDSTYHDYSFFSKRQLVVELKKNIGQLSHRLEVEWAGGSFEKRSHLCSDVSSGVRATYEQLKELIEAVPALDNFAEILMEDEKRRSFLGQKVEKQIPDSLQNQLDIIDAMLVSLSTKVAVMDRINDEQSKSDVYEKSVQDTICMCLDALLVLAESFMEAQLFGLVTELHRSSLAHLYFHIQIRTDFVLSQAITIAATAIVDAVYRGWPIFNGVAADLLLTISSFLSAYGDEKGMAEDAWEAWRQLEARVVFSLVRAPSQVCRTCVPLASGPRTHINISIPLPHDVYDSLPSELKSRKSIAVCCTYFNVGVNHEATLGQSFGGVALETAINQEGAERILAYSNRYSVDQSARDAVMELVNADKRFICCKSGKDRTGMAVTLEQGRMLRETCGLNAAQLQEVIASLRRDGARRENCRKNVGKAVYSFSPFQMHFLPKHSMSGDKVNGDELWQDKDIRFDVDHRMLRLVPGEIQIDRMDMVEDTKGNNGDRGVIRVTNLRLIWYASSMPRINLSIGYSNITGLQSREVVSKVRGTEVEALYVMARAPTTSTKFEFIFTAMTSGVGCTSAFVWFFGMNGSYLKMHSKLFNTVNSVHRAYETTKLYRELKMRGAIVDESNNLKLLPLEQLVDKVNGVWNLSTDQGTLGCFVITNVRLVWFASTNSLYNVSVPYLQLYSCRIRESKFGLALVIETTTQSGEYVLGFRIDPAERLQQVCKAIQALHKASNLRPIFGVTFHKDKPASPRETAADAANEQEEEDGEVEQKQLRTDAFAAYFSDGATHSEERRPPVFCEELGLAVEQLKPGFTIADLWNIYVD
ncbi:hypothetical protein OESDEN_06449 [Oesophagostomum dentatum]|uniref:BBSome complex member BBS5 PH domain-containing protein n=1 Tax=Oesophagostomum dentatum TaxID=61180 RepID=A0A0B1T8V3_OESDE|nr:hypothetical protein OESDEN_06449 [Oesophagostomum dentatum]